MISRHFRGLGLVLVAVSLGLASPQGPDQVISLNIPQLKNARLELGASSDQILAALTAVARDEWKPRVSGKSRGAAAALYPQIAPSVVLVRTEDGYGSGFVVDPDGWIVTNHHVIAEADVDSASGAQVATVYRGGIRDGLMALDEQGVKAVVYKADPVKDLALLRFERRVPSLSGLGLADAPPLPGTECVAIGHPAAGALWTIRSCEVAGVSQWPVDMIDVVMQRLAGSGDRSVARASLAKGLQRKILLSTCGLNPGDSGGPLVNGKGEVVGVSFGIPAGSTSEGARFDKFSYHVHVDELRSFLHERPSRPAPYVPDPWPPAAYSGKFDLDGDGVPDALVFKISADGDPTGIILDLQQRSNPNFDPRTLGDPANRRNWHFDFASQVRSTKIINFYDKAGTGKVDLILIDRKGEGVSDEAAVLEHNGWVWHTDMHWKMFNSDYFSRDDVKARFRRILQALKSK